MPSLATNLCIGVGGLTVVGGAVCGGYFLTRDNTQTIAELLKKNNKTLLTHADGDGDGAAWNAKWGSYIDANSTTSTGNTKTPKEKDIWGLSNWTTQKGTRTTAPASFKAKCGELAQQKVIDKNNETYKQVESYCAK